MSENSKIEWTTHTYNPWIGCTKVSPGCANCYAESEDKRRGWTEGGWGKGKPRKRTKTAKDVEKWNREEVKQPFICHGCGTRYFCKSGGHPNCNWQCNIVPFRPRVFCSSLADWLDDEVPIEWLADLLDLIRRTPNLDWLLLTKRPENWASRVSDAITVMDQWDHPAGQDTIAAWRYHNEPLNNVWLGTSVEDQKRADERIPVLLEIPAKVRFLSVEPQLGPVDLQQYYFTTHPENRRGVYPFQNVPPEYRTKWTDLLDWVICGGESGPGARPFDIQWARSLKKQCASAGVAFFMKQLGAAAFSLQAVPIGDAHPPILIKDKKGGDMAEWPEDLRVRQFPTP